MYPFNSIWYSMYVKKTSHINGLVQDCSNSYYRLALSHRYVPLVPANLLLIRERYETSTHKILIILACSSGWKITLCNLKWNKTTQKLPNLSLWCHMSVMATEITGNFTVCLTVSSGLQQRKHLSSTILGLLWTESTCDQWDPLRNGL